MNGNQNNQNSSRIRKLILLAIAAFCMGTGVTWFRISAISLCLSKHGSKTVAAATIVSMMLLPLLGLLFTRFTEGRKLKNTVSVTYSILGLIVLAIFSISIASSASFASPIMVLFIKLFSMFTFVPFWQLVAKLFPGQENSRICIWITSGFPVSQMVAGATCSSLSCQFGNLFPFYGAFVSLLLTAGLVHLVIGRQAVCSTAKEKSIKPVTQCRVRNGKLTWLVFGLTAAIAIVSALTTFIFQNAAELTVRNSNEMTDILGKVEMTIGGLELFIMLFVSGNLIHRWGIAPGLIFLPVLVSLISVVMFAGLWSNLGVLFFAATLAHVVESVTKPAFAKPSLKILIDKLPVGPRLKMIARVETICKPIASALAGGLVLVFASVSWLGIGWAVGVLLASTVCWLVAGTLAQRLLIQKQRQPTPLTPIPATSRPKVRTQFGRNTKWTVAGLLNWAKLLLNNVCSRSDQNQTIPVYSEPASVCSDSLVLTLPPNSLRKQ